MMIKFNNIRYGILLFFALSSILILVMCPLTTGYMRLYREIVCENQAPSVHKISKV